MSKKLVFIITCLLVSTVCQFSWAYDAATPQSIKSEANSAVVSFGQYPDYTTVEQDGFVFKIYYKKYAEYHGDPYILWFNADIIEYKKEARDENIVIPGTVEWGDKHINVTHINPDIFKGNKNIKHVSIVTPEPPSYHCYFGDSPMHTTPDVIDIDGIVIEAETFAGCTNLKTFSSDKYVEFSGARVFAGCNSLENISCGVHQYSGSRIVEDAFDGLNVKSLEIHGCELGNIDWNSCSIKNLNLYGCSLNNFSSASARTLSLHDCNLYGLECIVDCPELTKLTLDRPLKFSRNVESVVSNCPKLSELSIDFSDKYRQYEGKDYFIDINDIPNAMVVSCPSLKRVSIYDALPPKDYPLFDSESMPERVDVYFDATPKYSWYNLPLACENVYVYLKQGEDEPDEQMAYSPKCKLKLDSNETLRRLIIRHPYIVASPVDRNGVPSLEHLSQAMGYIDDDTFCNWNENPFDVFHADLFHVGNRAFTHCSGIADEPFSLVGNNDERGCDIYADIFHDTTVPAVGVGGNVRFHDSTFGKHDKVYIEASEYPLPLIGMEGDTKGGFSGSEIRELYINRELTTEPCEGFDERLHAFHDAKIGTLILSNLTSIPRNALIDGEFNIVDIASTVGRIEAGNLEGAKSINTIISRATVPPALKMEAYAGIAPDIRIVVPEESIEAYKTAEGWRDFSRFEALKTVGIDEVADDIADEPVEIYTLDGRRVAANRDVLTPGIYIVRGKKVVIR